MGDKFDFDDILIKPCEITQINSRDTINPYYGNYLPIMTAPMDTVVCEENFGTYLRNGVGVVLPRGINEDTFYSLKDKEDNNVFLSVSLTDFLMKYVSGRRDKYGFPPKRMLVDIANGHMESLINGVKSYKEMYPNHILMVGNVANPKTYTLLSDSGADYIRIGVGNGGGCLTTQNTGIGYPMGSLIYECHIESLFLSKPAKIVADGGMKKYSDIIKALALGADYVMLGSVLNKSLESSGDNYLFKHIPVSNSVAKFCYNNFNSTIYKKFRGMSTKEVQRKWGRDNIKTSEGVVRYRKVEYTLPQWVENFNHYLRSAMSYTNANDLSEFIGQAEIIHISDNSLKRFNK